MEFKIGDRVKVIGITSNHNIKIGMMGTVCRMYETDGVGVCFDKEINGHTCDGSCQDKRGWGIFKGNLSIIRKIDYFKIGEIVRVENNPDFDGIILAFNKEDDEDDEYWGRDEVLIKFPKEWSGKDDYSEWFDIDKITKLSKTLGSSSLEPSTESIINMSSLKDKAKLLFKGEPQRSFIKAGVMDSDENLTQDGKDLFTDFLLKKHQDEFKSEVVDKILEEDKE